MRPAQKLLLRNFFPFLKVDGVNKEKEVVLSLMNKMVYLSKQPGATRGERISHPVPRSPCAPPTLSLSVLVRSPFALVVKKRRTLSSGQAE